MVEYAQIALPENQDPKTIPNIIDIRRGIIGREQILQAISHSLTRFIAAPILTNFFSIASYPRSK